MALALDLASKRQRKPSDYPYHEEYRTRWADNDQFSHLNNPIYGILTDSIINSYLITQPPHPYSPQRSPYVGLVANTYCDYFGSCQYPGVLDVGLRFVKVGRGSVMWEVAFWQDGGDVKVVGGFVQIWVNRSTNKVEGEGVPKSIRDGIAPLLRGSEQDPSTPSSRKADDDTPLNKTAKL
ncbi:hypothetical protein LTR95_009113 [Oleoguttula sp. CCFEE 5521]